MSLERWDRTAVLNVWTRARLRGTNSPRLRVSSTRTEKYVYASGETDVPRGSSNVGEEAYNTVVLGVVQTDI